MILRRPRSLVAVLAAAALLAAGCGSSNESGSSDTSSTAAPTTAVSTEVSSSSQAPSSADTAPPASGSSGSMPSSGSGDVQLSGTLTVYAAASLKKVFDQLATDFGKEHPGLTVNPITYDGSSTLATQLIGGADADVFASADNKNMTKVTDAKLAADPVEFATNTLEIAVAPGNPKKVTGLKDLTSLTVVLCAPEVPCGSAAQTVLKAAKVDLKPASEEQNVTAVLTKVEAGEADAGLVYKTDVQGAGGKVDGVEFPESSGAVNHYPIVALTGSKNPTAAKAFIEYVTGPVGQKALADAGFVTK